jgi:hypothetical protein
VNVLGLDIGGANIKAATADGDSVSVPFAIWRDPDGLTRQLESLPLLSTSRPELVALTMTAELADCFATKADGVRFVIATVCRVFPGAVVRVWLTSGEFASADEASDLPELAAAANWHALATWAARAVPSGPALLVDIGSTTTDIVPLQDGLPCPTGLNDADRLAAGELLYTGIRRTPVCAILSSVPVPPDWHGPQPVSGRIPVAAELFATSLDVHLLNGDLPEDPADTDTADQRPATREAAGNRLAHMLCSDATELSEAQLKGIAAAISDHQVCQIAAAIRQQATQLMESTGTSRRALPVLLSGSGDWLAERALAEIRGLTFDPVLNLSARPVRSISPCAAAFAVARLAAERCRDDLLPLSQL